MKLAIAAETSKHPTRKADYKVWYLEMDSRGTVMGMGSVTREELVQDLFKSYQQTGKSNWRAFKKGQDKSTPIELYDFIAMNGQENTHFGNLPTLDQFQETLNQLKANMELRPIAC